MGMVSQREILDAGWSVLPRSWCLSRPEERFEDPDPYLTIQRIAQTQDQRAFSAIPQMLLGKARARVPQRVYSTQVSSTAEQVVLTWLFPTQEYLSMSTAYTATQTQHAHEQELHEIVHQILVEIDDAPPGDRERFFLEVVAPKYQEDLTTAQWRTVLEQLQPQFTQRTWTPARKSFKTKTLEVGLLGGEELDYVLEVRRHGEDQALWVTVRNHQIADPQEQLALATLLTNLRYLPVFLQSVITAFWP